MQRGEGTTAAREGQAHEGNSKSHGKWMIKRLGTRLFPFVQDESVDEQKKMSKKTAFILMIQLVALCGYAGSANLKL